MALHDPVEDAQRAASQGLVGPPAPEPRPGAIGEAIANENPSKVRQFFTDPKNLATMLVLASALAQPRTQGRKPFAHGLRAGVGALAFRGGLNQQITTQGQEAAEAESIVTGRAEQAAIGQGRNTIAQGQVDATTRGQDLEVTEGGLDRESSERIAAIRAAAVGGANEVENVLLKLGAEAYYKAVSDFEQGIIPNAPIPENYFVLPEGSTIGVEGLERADVPAEGDGTLEEPKVTTKTPKPPKTKAEELAPRLISGVVVPGRAFLRSDLGAEQVTRTVTRVARKGFPEAFEGKTDDEVLDIILGLQEDTRGQLIAGITQEEAKRIKNDPFVWAHITKPQQRAIALLARGKTPSTAEFTSDQLRAL